MPRFPRIAAALVLICATPAGPAAAGLPGFQRLGFHGDDRRSQAVAVSGDGRVVVGRSGTPNVKYAGFRWVDGVMTPLAVGQQPFLPQGTSFDGTTILGGTNGSAAIWRNGAITVLGAPPGTGGGVARASTPNSSVIVGDSSSLAVRWEDGGVTPLGSSSRGLVPLHANDVNAAGNVIVGTGWSPRGIEAFRWQDGQLHGLDDLPGGGVASSAAAVSNDGSVIVGTATSSDTYEAVRWEEGAIFRLGPFPTGRLDSHATAISADGSVIGGRVGREAFIWDRVHGARLLQTVLVDLGVSMDGWQLEEVSAIADDNRTFVGWGFNPDRLTEAWIATIPEPATILLLAFAGAVARPRRSRSDAADERRWG